MITATIIIVVVVVVILLLITTTTTIIIIIYLFVFLADMLSVVTPVMYESMLQGEGHPPPPRPPIYSFQQDFAETVLL